MCYTGKIRDIRNIRICPFCDRLHVYIEDTTYYVDCPQKTYMSDDDVALLSVRLCGDCLIWLERMEDKIKNELHKLRLT